MNSGPLAADGSDGATGLLASVSGDALALGEPGYLSYQSYSFSYTLGDTDIEAGTYNSAHDVGLRIAGATSSAIIDNVVVAVPEPGTFGLIAGCLALTSVMLRRRLG
jgi:hypothetical protein